jgi:excisionase family DNA binding protein
MMSECCLLGCRQRGTCELVPHRFANRVRYPGPYSNRPAEELEPSQIQNQDPTRLGMSAQVNVKNTALEVSSSEILTAEECAELLRVSLGWVHAKCRSRSRNPLPAHRVGRYLRFRRSEILAWFDSTLASAKKGRR